MIDAVDARCTPGSWMAPVLLAPGAVLVPGAYYAENQKMQNEQLNERSLCLALYMYSKLFVIDDGNRLFIS